MRKKEDIGDGRWRACVENVYKCVALGESGADTSGIPRSAMEVIANTGKKFTIEPFGKPVELETFANMHSASSFTASARAWLTIRSSLHCGTLRLKKVEFFLVVDQEMDEVILGRPLLKALGYDL